MKLVKEKSTNKYIKISQEEYDLNTGLYIDRSNNIIYWYNHYKEAGYLYWQMRNIARELMNLEVDKFNSFGNLEKDILGILGLGDQTQTIIFYMTYFGLNQQEASFLLVKRLSEHTSKLSVDARVIIQSPKIMRIGIKYLTWINTETGLLDSTQANNLTYAIQGFLTEFERYAVIGLNYGDEREGIMDYLESTNNYTSGGLKNYIFSPDIVAAYGSKDNARLAMIAELQEVFIKGNI